MLSDDFREFLGSFKNAESLSPELQTAIAVETGLEEVVSSALVDGRVVIVAGSAGSGKTHLIRSVVKKLGADVMLVDPGKNPRSPQPGVKGLGMPSSRALASPRVNSARDLAVGELVRGGTALALGSSADQAEQLIRAVDRQLGPGKALWIAGHDRLRAGLTRRLVQHGVLIVRESEVEGVRQDRPRDWGDLEETQKRADVLTGLRGTDCFRREIVDRGEGGGPQQPIDLLGGHAVEERGGRADMRGAGEQDVEDDVGVEEHSHRCFSARCLR